MLLKKIKKGCKLLKEKEYKTFIQKFICFLRISQFLELFCYPYVIFRIKRLDSKNPEEIFDFAWNFKNGTIRPMRISDLEFFRKYES